MSAYNVADIYAIFEEADYFSHHFRVIKQLTRSSREIGVSTCTCMLLVTMCDMDSPMPDVNKQSHLCRYEGIYKETLVTFLMDITLRDLTGMIHDVI